MANGYYPQLSVAVIDDEGYRQVVEDSYNVYNVTAAAALADLTSDENGIIDEGFYSGVSVGDVIELSHDTFPGTMRMVLQTDQVSAYTAVENDVTTFILENQFADTEDALTADIYIVDTSEPDDGPKLLGSVKAGETGQFPFQSTITKTMRVFAVSKGENFLRTENAFENGTDVVVTATTGQVGTLFDHYTNETTTGIIAENLYAYTMPAGTLANDGDKVLFEYSGIFTANTNTKRLLPKFHTTTLGTGQTALAASEDWAIDGYIIRVSNTVVRFAVEITASDTVLVVQSGEITGLNLTTTDYQIDLDAYTVAAAGEITANSGFGIFYPAAPPNNLLGGGDILLGGGEELIA
jgi:hypothetical protein